MTTQEDKPVSASLDFSLLLMDHVSNPTAMLILSAPNANKASSCACSASPQRTESSNYHRASVSAWMDTMLTRPTPVCLAQVDAVSAHLPLTALVVLLWQLPLLLDHATAPLKLTSLFHQTESDTALHVDHTALLALMPTPAPLVLLLSPRLLTISASAQPRTTSTLLDNVCHAPLDAKPAPLPTTAPSVLILWSFRAQFARLTATTASLLLDQSAKDAQLVAFSALKTSSATIALIVFTCTMEHATVSALLEPSETAHQQTGTVFLATLPAKPA